MNFTQFGIRLYLYLLIGLDNICLNMVVLLLQILLFWVPWFWIWLVWMLFLFWVLLYLECLNLTDLNLTDLNLTGLNLTGLNLAVLNLVVVVVFLSGVPGSGSCSRCWVPAPSSSSQVGVLVPVPPGWVPVLCSSSCGFRSVNNHNPVGRTWNILLASRRILQFIPRSSTWLSVRRVSCRSLLHPTAAQRCRPSCRST